MSVMVCTFITFTIVIFTSYIMYIMLLLLLLLLLQTNTFQCVLATDGVESFVIFLYAHNKIQWTTGNTSDGLGGTGALVGINAGDGVNYVAIHGSLTPEIINITERSNVGIPGVWMFQISKSMSQYYCKTHN